MELALSRRRSDKRGLYRTVCCRSSVRAWVRETIRLFVKYRPFDTYQHCQGHYKLNKGSGDWSVIYSNPEDEQAAALDNETPDSNVSVDDHSGNEWPSLGKADDVDDNDNNNNSPFICPLEMGPFYCQDDCDKDMDNTDFPTLLNLCLAPSFSSSTTAMPVLRIVFEELS